MHVANLCTWLGCEASDRLFSFQRQRCFNHSGSMSAAPCGKYGKKKFPHIPFRLPLTASNKRLSHSFCYRTPQGRQTSSVCNFLAKAYLNSSAFFFILTVESRLTCRGNGYLGREPPLKPTGRKSRPQKHESQSCTTEETL